MKVMHDRRELGITKQSFRRIKKSQSYTKRNFVLRLSDGTLWLLKATTDKKQGKREWAVNTRLRDCGMKCFHTAHFAWEGKQEQQTPDKDVFFLLMPYLPSNLRDITSDDQRRGLSDSELLAGLIDLASGLMRTHPILLLRYALFTFKKSLINP